MAARRPGFDRPRPIMHFRSLPCPQRRVPRRCRADAEEYEDTVIPALMPNYARADLAFERGEGARLWTADGRRFLDFGAGIATSSLGHGHPHLVKTIAEQAAKVIHVSNLYRVPQAEELAKRHVQNSFADSVFFCNSGAEANEGMVKAVRKYHAENGRPERFRMLCFEGAFHGRTLAMISATGNAKYLAGFGPPVEGFSHLPFGNMNAVRDAITPETAGIMIEPVQGEGGVRPADLRFLRELRAVCDEFGLLLALDEVQTGMGRSGKLWAHQWAGIEPDVMSSAKGIGGGFPLGAVFAKEAVAKHLKPGTHGTTYGGGPLACAAGNAVLDVMLAPGFLDGVDRVARHLWRGLLDLAQRHPAVIEGVQGAGLLLGLKLRDGVVNTAMQDAAVQEGLLTVAAGMNVLRLAPPLIITEADADEALALLDRTCRKMTPSTAKAAAK
jgi:acetylornithine/N-succinyldiaminopimelate aminotransferase